MDPGTIAGVIALAGVLIQGIVAWARHRGETELSIDTMLDARVVREINRMEGEIAALRKRVWQLEQEMAKHNVPVPPFFVAGGGVDEG